MNSPIPCVGFELLYSPVDRNYMENIALLIHRKSNRFIFNVEENLKIDQKVVILFSNNNGPTELLYAVVRNCLQLDEENYQATLETQPGSEINKDIASLITIPINKGPSTPQEIFLTCPSCKQSTHFHYIANQDGDWEKGILPIYNCKSCGTTRAMTGLVK